LASECRSRFPARFSASNPRFPRAGAIRLRRKSPAQMMKSSSFSYGGSFAAGGLASPFSECAGAGGRTATGFGRCPLSAEEFSMPQCLHLNFFMLGSTFTFIPQWAQWTVVAFVLTLLIGEDLEKFLNFAELLRRNLEFPEDRFVR